MEGLSLRLAEGDVVLPVKIVESWRRRVRVLAAMRPDRYTVRYLISIRIPTVYVPRTYVVYVVYVRSVSHVGRNLQPNK